MIQRKKNREKNSTKSMSVICVIFAVVVKDLVEKKEVYKHRVDKLETKVHNMTTGLITEFFTPGRLDCLKGQKQFITQISKSLFLARFLQPCCSCGRENHSECVLVLKYAHLLQG